MKLRIHKKDQVYVISGRDKGRTGEVMEVIAPEGRRPARVIVSKINMVTKHKRPTDKDTGGIVRFEAPMPISKVMLIDPKTNKPTRTRVKVAADGSKTRVAVGSGQTIE